MEANADILFEVSWEVVNKVGGINTVIISKVEQMQNYYKDYLLIGPYFENKAQEELEELQPPEWMKPGIEKLKKENVIIHYGKWLIKGEPKVILVEYLSQVSKKNEIKKILWDEYKVDSITSGWEFDEPLIWSWTVGQVIEALTENQDKKIVGQFHEWMSGIGLLYLDHKKSNVKTVFTTHATILGRSIAGVGRSLYEELPNIDADKEAYNLSIASKHLAEKACANKAHIFTTVSEITAIEAEKLLGRKPEVLVLNGLDILKFPSFEDASVMHVQNRELIREFLRYQFFPYYTFDLEHTLHFFVLGRYEFRNKGMDLTIEALGNLNKLLIEHKSERTITCFFCIPMDSRGVKFELLENKNVYKHITQFVKRHSRKILTKIVEQFISNKASELDVLFSKEFIYEIKRDIMHFKRTGNPLMLTHNIINEHQDAILNALKFHGLDNKQDDKVKVILYPVYLNSEDGVLGMHDQYDFISGCHLGIFPSYYEPWGYTPLESVAMGVSAITSDLSGFGKFIEPQLLKETPGVFVLKRHQKSWEEQVKELTDSLFEYCNLDHAQRVQNKINAKSMSNMADWKHLVKNYVKAHNEALTK